MEREDEFKAWKTLIKSALEEDLYRKDITTNLVLAKSKDEIREGEIVAKSNGVLAGLPLAISTFRFIDKSILITKLKEEGEIFNPNDKIISIKGKIHSLLSGERTALNFLAHLSGIATITRKFVDLVAPFKAKIYDTRKTLPLLRSIEKYAVKIGGGYNHRFSLSSWILIKSNHYRAVGGLKEMLSTLPTFINSLVKKKINLEIEVNTIQDLKLILESNIKWDIIMLDNMVVEEVKEAVDIIRNKREDIEIEVSGNINLENVVAYASCGVDRISVGELTHSPKAADFNLRIK